MTQIHKILESLDAIASDDPMASALADAGFVGGLHHGSDASRDEDHPFGLLNATEVESQGNSSGVRLVTYRIDLTVVVDESNDVTGNLLALFHRFWDRLSGPDALPSLDSDLAKFVLIWPASAESGEDENQDLGKDILLGITAWTLRLSEHQPSLE